MAPALWTFVDVPGVEPTNNAAERPLRPAVLWRRKSFGTRGAAGSRFASRMLTVAATLKAQQRNIVDYVTQASSLRSTGPRSITPASPLAQVRSSLNAYAAEISAGSSPHSRTRFDP